MSEDKSKTVRAVRSRKKEEINEVEQASLESQARLAEILSDSPRLVSLNGTEWEVRALRMGTQWLIADRVCKINKKVGATMGDIMKDFQVNIPSVVEVLTLALLNDKDKIFAGGYESKGYSKLYHTTYNTLMWECPVQDFANILLEILQMLDINFTMDAVDMITLLTASVTMKKREKTKKQK